MADPGPDATKVIETIQRWLYEARDFRNDGYVQHGYTEKLMAVHAITTAALQTLGLVTNISSEKSN